MLPMMTLMSARPAPPPKAPPAFFCPAAADSPANRMCRLLMTASDVLMVCRWSQTAAMSPPPHLHQLAQTDRQTGGGHDGDDPVMRTLPSFCKKSEVDETLLFRLLCAGLFSAAIATTSAPSAGCVPLWTSGSAPASCLPPRKSLGTVRLRHHLRRRSGR